MTQSRLKGRIGATVVSLAAEGVATAFNDLSLTMRRGNNFYWNFIRRKAGATFMQAHEFVSEYT